MAVAAAIFLTGAAEDAPGTQVLLDPAMQALLEDASFKRIVIVGGPVVVSEDCEYRQLKNEYCAKADVDPGAVMRLAGETAIDTSAAIVAWECEDAQGMDASNAFVATINGYRDALCGAPVCARNNQILALIDRDFAKTDAVDAALQAKGITHFNVLGGSCAISGDAVSALEAKLAQG